MDDLFIGTGVGIEQTFYDFLLLDRPGDDFGNILGLYLEIADFLRMNDDHRAPLTKAVAACPPDIHCSRSSPCFINLRFEARGDAPTAGGMAGRSGTECNTGLVGVSLRRMPFLNTSNSAGEFIRGIVFVLIIVFQHIRRLGRRHLPVGLPVDLHTGPKAQQPRQLTVSRLNFMSMSVSPGLIPVRSCTVSRRPGRRGHGRLCPCIRESHGVLWELD